MPQCRGAPGREQLALITLVALAGLSQVGVVIVVLVDHICWQNGGLISFVILEIHLSPVLLVAIFVNIYSMGIVFALVRNRVSDSSMSKKNSAFLLNCSSINVVNING
jgi:hypothetical protein